MTTVRSQPLPKLLPWLLTGVIALAQLAGCATTRSADTQLDDTGMTFAVSTELLADPDINRFRIDVDVQSGVVTLYGDVDSPDEIGEAVRIAAEVDGVVDVVSHLRVHPSPQDEPSQTFQDAWIGAMIEAKLAFDPAVHEANVNVYVEDGVATLTGTVEDLRARQEALELAYTVDGVRDVRDDLAIDL